ncbi:MAG TPA: GNAT family protein [Longimicrobiales bacterium]
MIPDAPPLLTGRDIRLEPLTRAHIPALIEVGLAPDLWQWTVGQVRTAADMTAYVETALEEQRLGRSLPYATVDRVSGRVIGSTRFGSIERHHRRVEIGWTWLAPAWQRTAANTEAKYLMLRCAFETMDCMRVELKTDRLNERSRTAIRRIGAVEEGTLRSHMVTESGRVRDTVYYSIVAAEWPEARTRLEARLAAGIRA